MRRSGIQRVFQEYKNLRNLEYDLQYDEDFSTLKIDFRKNKEKFSDLINWDRGRWYFNRSWKAYRDNQWK